MRHTSEITKNLKKSGIQATSKLCSDIDGINLGQGVGNLPIEENIKHAAYRAIAENKNIYSPGEGILELREAISHKQRSFNNMVVDPLTDIAITHGSTGAFVTAVASLFNTDDEVILFEPFYSYHKSILELYGVKPVTVPIQLDTFNIDFELLRKAIGPKTRGIVICTPGNPSGKVFTREELLIIGQIAEENQLWVIADEIYEYITFPNHPHVSFASLANFKEFTLTISGFSKTYNMTGWRMGYVVGPADIIKKIILVQDILYICPSTPLQYAVLSAFELQASYYQTMYQSYLYKRDRLVSVLREIGFKITAPQGSYYFLADFTPLGFKDDEDASRNLLENAKIAAVPGRYFYNDQSIAQSTLRFCFAMDEETIERALVNLQETFLTA